MSECKLKVALLLLTLAMFNYVYLVSSECSDNFFDCKNGKCIAHFQCDEDSDCGNFEDEMNCFNNGQNETFHVFQPERSCPEGHFACNDSFHTCLPMRWVCDGMIECSNGAHEKNCTSDSVGCGDDFKCDNLQCMPQMWRCDGISDCDDSSDEKNCTSFKKTDLCDKEHGMFQCQTGECIAYSKMCDKHPDCLLGDDEGQQCHVSACHEKKCSHLCMFNPQTNTSVCYCPPGYRLINDTCHDFNECDDNKLTNVCSQKCINLEGSFKCDCFDDYEMVNSTCQVKGESPVLYLSTGKEIRALSLRNNTYYPVVEAKNTEIIVGMDIVVASQKLFYFGSTENSHGCVYEVSIAGEKQLKTETELLYHEELKGIEGLAVDWLAGHFYITESANNRIIVCNIDSVICATLMDNLNSPRGILAVPQKGKLFWTQWGKQSGIFQAGMDGFEPSLLMDKITWPNDLTMDEEMNRLYWCDGKDGVIEFYDFDTQVRHLVFKDHNRQPYSLFVFEDNLYWSDWATNQIEVCNKISGHNMKPILMDPKDRFFGLSVYHPAMHKSTHLRYYNPCEVSPCSHMCLVRAGATSYTCRCPDHMTLASDKHNCIAKSDEPFLLVSTGHKVLKYYLNSISGSHSEQLKILPMYNIAEVAYNFATSELYIHDTFKNRIGALDLKKKSHLQWRTLVSDSLSGVMSLVYDVNTENLYWVDLIKGSLEAAATNGYGRATLNSQLVKPISLAISAEARKMYVGLRSNPSEIISLDMEGKSKQTLTVSPTGLPLAIVLDGSNQIMWGDPVLQKIEFIELRNQRPVNQPHKLISSHVETINSIAVSNGTIYWTNIDSPSFYYSSVEASGKRIVHQKRIADPQINLDLLKVIVGAKQTPVYDYCQAGKHKCAHLCLISASGSSCKCSDGFSSTNSGLTCIKSKAKPQSSVLSLPQLDPERFLEMLAESMQHVDNNDADTWVINNSEPATQKNSSLPSKSKKVIDTNNEPKVTDKADEAAVQAQSSQASGLSFFFLLVCYFAIASIAVFALFLWKSDSLRHNVFSSFDQIRNRDTKKIRFVRNTNFEPDYVTSVEAAEPRDKHQQSSGANNDLLD